MHTNVKCDQHFGQLLTATVTVTGTDFGQNYSSCRLVSQPRLLTSFNNHDFTTHVQIYIGLYKLYLNNACMI